MTKRNSVIVCWLCSATFGLPTAVGGLMFNFTDGPELTSLMTTDLTTYNNVRNGFAAAGNLFSAAFDDDVTLNVEINFKSLGSGILGSTSNVTAQANYSALRPALISDASSAVDTLATANLQSTSSLDFISTNLSTPYRSNSTDAWTLAMDVPRSNLKALGLLGGTDGGNGSEGTITFSDLFTWDFDRGDGIDGSAFDFIGVAAHEIGHLMGFVSGVDVVDQNQGIDLRPFRVFSVLDLYRYSADSLAESGQPTDGAVLDLRFGGTPYFSLDAGVTNLGLFSTGSANGDGRQASHWKDNLGLGLMDPTFAPGEFGDITQLDLDGFDAIGWDAVAVPEPSSFLLLSLAACGLFLRYKRRKKTAVCHRLVN